MKRLINRNWYFSYGNQLGDLHQLEKANFSPIGLPHTFDLPYYGGTGFYVGYGVYKKEFVLVEQDLRSTVWMEFLGVFQEAEIYVNGNYITKHRGGYTGFVVNLTQAVHAGKNLLTVRVNNMWQSDLPPRAGEYLFCGGIYRDVSLIFVPSAHIKWNGIFVKSTVNAQNNADITIEIETSNADGKIIQLEIYDPDHHCVASTRITAKEFTAATLTIPDPLLWDLDAPNLYMLQCVLESQTETVAFGIRTIAFSAEKGFFLNGKHRYLEGVNLHQDRGGWGDAATIEGLRRDLRMMKEAGFHFIRACTYPRHPFFAQECDRLGLLVWYESTFWGIGGFKDEGFWNASAMPTQQEDIEPFSDNCLYALDEMIRANRNSPSIIVWSMGNEVFFTKKNRMAETKILLQKMIDRSHQLDDTRPAGIGGTQRGGLHLMGDITGLNGDGAVLFKKPEIPNLVSEYGSIISDRPGNYELNYTAGAKDRPEWRCGRTLWCGFHHGSIADIGKMGIADLYRVPLKAYYCYREKLTGTPPPPFPHSSTAHHLKITADKTTIKTDGTDDTMLTVTMRDADDAYINSEDTILLEVIHGNGIFPTGTAWRMERENLTFLDGIGAIEMRAYQKGDITVRASCKSALPAEITISAMDCPGETEGEPVHYPKCPDKTYLKTAHNIDLICNRPVWSSSESSKHTGCCANDGTIDTFWKPLPDDEHPYLIFDMENFYTPKSMVLWLSKVRTRIKIEVSRDKLQWQTVYHNPVFQKAFTRGKKIKLKPVTARYLRISVEKKRVHIIQAQLYM